MRSLTFNAPLLVSLAAIAVAGLIGIAQLPALAGVLFIGAPGEDPTLDRLQQYLDAGERELATYTARFDGRSFFYKPKPPVTAAPPAPARNGPVAPPPPPPPVQPRPYAGPSVTYVFGDAVCFHDGTLLRVGEERSGVKVIATNPPWSVSLGWSGGTYEVDVFKRTSIGFEAETGAPPATAAVTPPVAGGGFVPERKAGG